MTFREEVDDMKPVICQNCERFTKTKHGKGWCKYWMDYQARKGYCAEFERKK